MVCKYRGVYILCVLPLLLASGSSAEWYPNITLKRASCKSVFVEATCPFLSKTRNLEFQLHDIRDTIKDGPLNSKKCDEHITVLVEFNIDCKSVYRVNVSMSIDSVLMECDKFCSVSHTSPTWLLGDEWCSHAEIEKCQYDQFTTERNNCTASSKQCDNAITTAEIETKAPMWSTRIELISATCDRLIVEATCPPWKTDKLLQMQLYSLIKSPDFIQFNVTNSCKDSVSRVVRGEFSIMCKSLYQIRVTLVTSNPAEDCDRHCTTMHQNSTWLLGDRPCTGITDSLLGKKYNTSVNTCGVTKGNSTGSLKKIYIALGIILALLVVAAIIGIVFLSRIGFRKNISSPNSNYNVLLKTTDFI